MASSLLWSASQLPDLKGRVAIVTGSDTGIGYEAAHELAKHGAHVIVATRDEKKGTECAHQIQAYAHRDGHCDRIGALLGCRAARTPSCRALMPNCTHAMIRTRACRAAEAIQKDAPEGKAEFIKLELASFKCVRSWLVAL